MLKQKRTARSTSERSGPILSRLINLPDRLRRRTSSGVYRPEIDGLRFWAITIVVAGHLAERALRFGAAGGDAATRIIQLLAHPASGVLLFFSISGFIIVRQFTAEPFHLRGDFLRHYFSRRILRIEPPYLLLLLVTYLLFQLSGFRPPESPRFDAGPASLTESLVASLLYSHGWFYRAMPRLFPPGWSLEVEVQFYLLAPFLIWAYLAVARSLRAAVGQIVLAASLALAVVLPRLVAVEFTILTIFGYLSFFWLGALLAVHRRSVEAWLARAPSGLMAAAAWAGLAVFWAAGAVGIPGVAWSAARLALQLAGAALMLASTLHPANGFKSVCSLGWISLLGSACYSIYLTHLQVLHVAATVLRRLQPGLSVAECFAGLLLVGLPLVLGAGIVFFAVVERFFMKPHWPSLAAGVFRRRRAPVQAPGASTP